MQDIGIDLADTELMHTRSWSWLQRRIAGLVTRPHTFIVLGYDAQKNLVTQPVYATRLQESLAEQRNHS